MDFQFIFFRFFPRLIPNKLVWFLFLIQHNVENQWFFALLRYNVIQLLFKHCFWHLVRRMCLSDFVGLLLYYSNILFLKNLRYSQTIQPILKYHIPFYSELACVIVRGVCVCVWLGWLAPCYWQLLCQLARYIGYHMEAESKIILS